MYAHVFSAFQATPRKTIIAENSIHTIKPIAAANYVDNGYYLFNRRYPTVGIAISISM